MEALREEVPVETNLSPGICRLMDAIGDVPKDGTNEFHKYRFLSASALLNRIRPALVSLDAFSTVEYQIVSQERIYRQDGETKTDKGLLVTVRCHLRVTFPDGVVEAITYGSGMDTGDKAVAKAMTMAHKYGWWHLLNISTEDDPEADTKTDANTVEPIKTPSGNTGTVMAKILNVNSAPTKTGGTRYTLATSKGEFHTFDKDVATSAEVARAADLEMEINYSEGKYGKDIIAKRASRS